MECLKRQLSAVRAAADRSAGLCIAEQMLGLCPFRITADPCLCGSSPPWQIYRKVHAVPPPPIILVQGTLDYIELTL
jgi:hypothetical protein